MGTLCVLYWLAGGYIFLSKGLGLVDDVCFVTKKTHGCMCWTALYDPNLGRLI